MGEPKKLHVGCGRNIMEGWINLDHADVDGIDIQYDLEKCRHEPIPLEDNSIDEFLISHVIEHIKDAMGMMQEMYRLAKPGATCIIRVPHGASDDAWEDPTHVRPYYTNSFMYFSQPTYWRADYGYRGDWQCEQLQLNLVKKKYEGMNLQQIVPILENQRNVIHEMVALMRAVKPMREPKRELMQNPKVELNLMG